MKPFSLPLLLALCIVPFALTACLPQIGDKGQPQQKQEYLKGKTPAQFPNVPLDQKAEVIESYAFNNTYGLTAVTGDKVDKVVSFYSSSLAATGWEAVLKENSEDNFEFAVKNSNYKGSIIVNRALDKRTAITIALEPR